MLHRTVVRCLWVLQSVFRKSRASHNVAHVIQSAAYQPVPSQLSLRNVVVIHRHGDRSQISREIGPKYPEDHQIETTWTNAMPHAQSLRAMAAAAELPEEFASSASKEAKDALYTGWDQLNTPYGQLTELGVRQLMNIGEELRRRYVGTLLPADNTDDMSSLLYCRSTNFCRTMQSLRALLSGLLAIDGSTFPPTLSTRLPTILSRPKNKETMFPSADGPCLKMNERRAEIFPPELYYSLPYFKRLEKRMQELLGYKDKVSWVTVKEILTCYEAHGIDFPQGITEEDADQVTKLAGWMWGTLYQDDELNRFAIGRFLRELLDVLDASVLHQKSTPTTGVAAGIDADADADTTCPPPVFFLFSGHDSTLVPVLCALGIYDNNWPPYASYLTIEIAESTTTAGELFVRAIYNDQEMRISSCDSMWCPYAVFQQRLARFALTPEEYVAGCAECSAANSTAIFNAQQEINEDLKATMSSRA